MVTPPTLLNTSFGSESKNVFGDSGEFTLNKDLLEGITQEAESSLSKETCNLLLSLLTKGPDPMDYFNGITGEQAQKQIT